MSLEEGVSDAVWQSRTSVVGRSAARGVSSAGPGAGIPALAGVDPDLADRTGRRAGGRPPLNPAIATVPYGVELAGTASGGGAGFSVTDVGDLTGSGYDDFVVGGPTITQNGQPNLGLGNNSAVYLIFGSATTNAGTISNWLNISQAGTGGVGSAGQPGDQRVGDLTLLGNTPTLQNNPITGHPTYPFAGIRFITSQETGSQLGASVAAAGVINGQRAVPHRRPGARDTNLQNPGTGRAYLIYGGNALLNLGSTFQTIDLDNANQNSGLNIVTFINNNDPAGRTGQSVAGDRRHLRRRAPTTSPSAPRRDGQRPGRRGRRLRGLGGHPAPQRHDRPESGRPGQRAAGHPVHRGRRRRPGRLRGRRRRQHRPGHLDHRLADRGLRHRRPRGQRRHRGPPT